MCNSLPAFKKMERGLIAKLSTHSIKLPNSLVFVLCFCLNILESDSADLLLLDLLTSIIEQLCINRT